MTEWEGWSLNQRDVEVSRLIAELFHGVGRYDDIPGPISTVIAELDLELDHEELEIELTHRGLLDDQMLAGIAFTDKGWLVAEEFRRAAVDRPIRARASRGAVLRWLYDQDHSTRWPRLEDMLSSPHSWFYGSQFTADELADAATNLRDRRCVELNGTLQAPALRARLEALGTRCVERYGGDPDQMEIAMTSGHQFNIGTFTQQGGNTAFGATIGTQTSTTTITIGQTAADLIALLHAIRDLGGIPVEAQVEADEVTADLQAAAGGAAEPAKAIGRAKTFFHWLQQFAQPATQAVLTAAGNYAALQLGMLHN